MGWANPLTLRRQGILGMNRRNVAYIGRYNSRRNFPAVDNKLKTKLRANRAGVAVPELLHVLHTQRQIEQVVQLIGTLDEFVVKPAQGSGGKGILVITGRQADQYIRNNGELISIQEIKYHLSNIVSGLYSLGGRTDVAIIEALVKFDPIFTELSYEGVPDIRLIIFRGYPVMGMLRLATKKSDGKANLHQGAVGVGLDIATGKSVGAVQHNLPAQIHPDTRQPLHGISIPYWRNLLILAARCYDLSELGYMGADLVLDKHLGPLLLELNARPGLSIQIANNQGLLPRLRRIEKLEELHSSVYDRVDFAMQHFAREPTHSQRSFWGDSHEPD